MLPTLLLLLPSKHSTTREVIREVPYCVVPASAISSADTSHLLPLASLTKYEQSMAGAANRHVASPSALYRVYQSKDLIKRVCCRPPALSLSYIHT